MSPKLPVLLFLLSGAGWAVPGRAGQKPLNKIQVVGLVAGGVASERVVMLVKQRGIAFKPTADYLRQLRRAGAEEVLLQALRAAQTPKPQPAEMATTTAEDSIEQHLVHGAELQAGKLYPQAEQAYRSASQLNPESAILHFDLGYVLAEQKNWKDAIVEYRASLRQDPDNDYVHNNLGAMLSQEADVDGSPNTARR